MIIAQIFEARWQIMKCEISGRTWKQNDRWKRTKTQANEKVDKINTKRKVFFCYKARDLHEKA